MFKTDASLAEFDPEVAVVMEAERVRQEEHIELIASENYTSPFVMEAQGSVLTTLIGASDWGNTFPKKTN